WCCDANLQLTQAAVAWAAERPLGHVYLAGPPLWWVLGFYGLLATLLALPHWRPPRRWCAALLLAWLAVAALAPGIVRGRRPWASGQAELRCTFLSVGHGCCCVLELPDGRVMLYDAGQLGSPEAGARSISAYLWSRQIDHLDAVVLSHADVDHYNALPGLLKRFSIGSVVVSPVMFQDDAPALAALAEEIAAHNTPLTVVSSQQPAFHVGEVRIEVLHPPPQGVAGSDNANSVVLLVEYAGRKILLPGDLEPPGLGDVLAELPIDVDMALAPHHGSVRSSPTGFAQWCRPEFVVVSGGHGFDAEQARQAYTSAGATVLHTAETGAVTVRVSAGALVVETFRPGEEPLPTVH
ncbi:MAG: MBL fold metallo-hydrolase, partial [Planctomycetales bacterium]|nr:MBL fold metallo-hydrolase [Planctomycetales bacterium]